MASKLRHLRILNQRISHLYVAGFKDQNCRFVTSSHLAVHSSENKHTVPLQHFNQEPVGEPQLQDRALNEEDYFGVKNFVKLHELFAARVHFGHKAGCCNPKMVPYLFGSRLGVDIIDLEKTVPLLRYALNFTAHIAYREGIILFISRNKQNMPVIEETAKECGEYAHCRYWRGGMFTDYKNQYKSETRLPDLCIFLNTLNSQFEDHVAISECSKMLIPTIGIVDTNCDPSTVTFAVPGNDDSPDSVKLYCKLFKQAILRGKEKRVEDQLDS